MIEFKSAVEADADFITEVITEAEKSGTETLGYARNFNIGDKQAGEIFSWIEAQDDIPSNILKANVLFYFLGNDIIAKASEKSSVFDLLNIHREQGTLQVESVYVCNKLRGMGVSNKLILEHIKQMLLTGKSFSKVQIQFAETNSSTLSSYRKLGFEICVRKKSNYPDILNYLPSNSKIIMETPVSTLFDKVLN